MKISKELVKDFINHTPLKIFYSSRDDKISTIGIKWGFCKEANETYGRKTVMKILDKLETDKEYQELLDK